MSVERRYLVKWTDTESGYHIPCERRKLTQAQAHEFADGFEQRRARYYTGIMASACPYRDVRVMVECDCGRDVTPGTEHTIPYTHGETCPGIREAVAA